MFSVVSVRFTGVALGQVVYDPGEGDSGQGLAWSIVLGGWGGGWVR